MNLSLEEVRAAEKRIRPYLPKTPLIRCQEHLFLKCEHLQATGSFKARGAFNALLHLTPEQKNSGVITRSSGNFAQALAYAGSVLGIPTTIVMPQNAPLVKRENTEKYGATVILAGPTHPEQTAKVEEIAKKENLVTLSPFDHPDVIAGAGTIALEIWEQLPSITQYFCQIGGGGLMSGSSATLKALSPRIEVTGIEPVGANDYFLSRQKHQRVKLEKIDTIADGLRAPQVGNLPWDLLEKNVDKVATVTDAEIKKTMRFLYEKMGLMIEPSGAVSLAYALAHPEPLLKDTVCVLSGGNVDRDNFNKWIL